MEENKVEEVEVSIPEITLDKVVSQLREALIEANALILKYKTKLNNIVDRENSVISREGDLNTKEKGFSDREESIKKVEDIISMKKSADSALAEAQEIRAANKSDRETFESFRIGENSRINELRLTAQKESDNVLEARKQIEDEVTKRVNESLKRMGLLKE